MIRRTIIRVTPVILAGLLLLPAVALSHDPHVPPADSGAIRSQSMTLQASKFACHGGRTSPMRHHGGDIAFWRDRAVLACSGDDWEISDDGFAILDVSDPRHPTVLGRLSCVGSASDIAIWGDLVFLAVDTNSEAIENGFSPGPARNEGDTCAAPVAGRIPSHDENRFAGVRIISIADPRHPEQIKAVETNPIGTRKRGTHGLSLVPMDDDTLLIYNANHGGGHDLDIVKVPLSRPEAAEVVPQKFKPATANGCHDIAIFLPRRLAACTSPAVEPHEVTETILYDISKPLKPKMKGRIGVTSNGRNDHSSTFSWDGNTLIVTDEHFGSLATGECKERGGLDQGVLTFYDVEDPSRPTLLAQQPPHPVRGVDWCHPKQLNVVPLPSGDDVLVASWVGGGTTVVDFTGLNRSDDKPGRSPREVAHYLVPRGLPGGGTGQLGNPNVTVHWSSYWHNGYVYANNTWACFFALCMGTQARGLDVFSLDFRDDPALPKKDRVRLANAFDDALELPWFNSYVQACLPRGFGDAHGSGEAHEACRPTQRS